MLPVISTQDKILYPVIVFYHIDMVNALFGGYVPPDMLLNYQSVFWNKSLPGGRMILSFNQNMATVRATFILSGSIRHETKLVTTSVGARKMLLSGSVLSAY